MGKPRLDFFRFPLNHNSGEFKTFRNFMIENRGCKKTDSDTTIFQEIFKYFMNAPQKDFAKNNRLKKVFTLIKNKTINKHYDKRPSIHSNDFIFSGVITGGAYGKERILSDLEDKTASEKVKATQPVLQYYYIFVYIPVNHNEGFFMIHSNGPDESISNLMRNYIASLFKKGEYNKPIMQSFCPKDFQSEFKENALIKNFSFKTTIIDNQINENNPIKDLISEYDIKIEAIPKNKEIPIDSANIIMGYFRNKIFGKNDYNKRLDEFENVKMSAKNKETNSSKTFEWNLKDEEFIPVVFLKGRILFEEDDTPNFESLKKYCENLFNDTILKEIRKDLDVRRIN